MYALQKMPHYIFFWLNFFIKNLYRSFLTSCLVIDGSTLSTCSSCSGDLLLQDPPEFSFSGQSTLIVVKLTMSYSEISQPGMWAKVKSIRDACVPLLCGKWSLDWWSLAVQGHTLAMALHSLLSLCAALVSPSPTLQEDFPALCFQTP